MLGGSIADPDGIEGLPGSVPGLGLLDVDTVLRADKVVRPAAGRHLATGAEVAGYEIHLGETAGLDAARPLLELADGRPDGAQSADGRVAGTYLHGIFAADGFRRAYLGGFGRASDLAYEARIEASLDALADHLAAHLDLDRILAIARSR